MYLLPSSLRLLMFLLLVVFDRLRLLSEGESHAVIFHLADGENKNKKKTTTSSGWSRDAQKPYVKEDLVGVWLHSREPREEEEVEEGSSLVLDIHRRVVWRKRERFQIGVYIHLRRPREVGEKKEIRIGGIHQGLNQEREKKNHNNS